MSCKPFLKWAGSKAALCLEILKYFPDRYGAYYEPFLGGGSVFFNNVGEHHKCYLSDKNEALIRTFRGVRDCVARVASLLVEYPNDKAFFEEMRQKSIGSMDDAETAAWFIYLNRTAFNGLYRVNSRNQFNVSFGYYNNPKICFEEDLIACSNRLKSVAITYSDFEEAALSAEALDLVYFDPPYIPVSTTSSFTSYTTGGFGLLDHVRLKDLALELHRRRVYVLISNSYSDVTRELYGEQFHYFELSTVRKIRPKQQEQVKEYLIMPKQSLLSPPSYLVRAYCR